MSTEPQMHWPEDGAPEEKTTSVMTLILALMFLAVVVAAVGVYIYFGMQHTPADEMAPVTEEFAPAEQASVESRLQSMQRTSRLPTTEEYNRLQAMNAGGEESALTEAERRTLLEAMQ